MLKKIHFLLLLIASCLTLKAADFPLRFQAFPLNDRLASQGVTTVFEDPVGTLWIGTTRGVMRYDGHRLVPFNTKDAIQEILSRAHTLSIKPGQQEDIWIATFGDGLIHYNRQNGVFTHFTSSPDQPESLPSNEVVDIVIGSEGSIWVATTNGIGIYRPESSDFDRIQHDPESSNTISLDYLYDIAAAPNGDIWVSSTQGLNRIQTSGDNYSITAYDSLLLSSSIWRISIDQQGAVWLAYVEKGLGRFDPISRTVRSFDLPGNAASSRINDIYHDKNGRVWLALQKQGLVCFNPNDEVFERFIHDACDPESIGGNVLNQVHPGVEGRWWVAHNLGISMFNPYQRAIHASKVSSKGMSGDIYPQVIARNGDRPCIVGTSDGLFQWDWRKDEYRFIVDPASLREKTGVFPLRSLFVSSTDDVWIGPYFYGPMSYNLKTGAVRVFDAQIGNTTDFQEDAEGNIWFTTDGNGLGFWERGVDTVRFFKPKDEARTQALIRFLCFNKDEEEKGFWIGGANEGLYYFNLKDRTFTRHITTDEGGLPHNTIVDLQADEEGMLWLASTNGLIKWNPNTNKSLTFSEKDGLPEDKLMALEFDDQERLWIGTSMGLSCFDIEQGHFINYSSQDGLSDDQVLFRSLRYKGDHMMVVTRLGLSHFSTSRLGTAEKGVPIVLSSFQVLNEPYELGKDASLVKDIHIQHDDYTFTFFFASPTSKQPVQRDYSYKLEGLDEDWIPVGNRNYATFTSLPPDDYIFRVKSNAFGIDEEESMLEVKLHIQPAFWQQTWFRGLIILLACLTFAAFIWLGKRQLDAKHEAALAQQSAEYKSQFLANMSHEIRTPLHAVLGAADLLVRSDLSQNQHQYLHHIRQSGKHLMGLLDDILDFSKIEANKLEFHPRNFELEEALTYVEDTLRQKLITSGTDFNIEQKAGVPQLLYGDPVRLGQVLINLLNNAINFAPKGKVLLRIWLENEVEDKLQLGFTVQDNGVGIPEDELVHIFTSFHQAANQPSEAGGSGLGLAITKALVEQQGGSISVKSKKGQGATFSAIIPFAKAQAEVATGAENQSGSTAPIKKIMMVEDMEVNRELGLDMLQQAYPEAEIILAIEGQDALNQLESMESLPDLILMDIRMPGMDGLICTGHIRARYGAMVPIMALSASATREERERYLQAGLDSLLPKPFAPKELTEAIHTLMHIPQKDALAVNMEGLGHFLGNDEDRISRYLVSSRQEIRKQLNSLRVELANDRWGQARVAAHSLKTTFSYLGIKPLQQMAADMEELIKEGRPEVFCDMIPEFVKMIKGIKLENSDF